MTYPRVRWFAALAVWSCLVSWGSPTRPVPTFRAGDVPRMFLAGKCPDYPIQFVLEFPPTPTADPLIWNYRPSAFGTVPPSIRFHFRSVPKGPFKTVTGTVSRLEFDLKRRVGGVPGIVVTVGCRVP